MNAYDFLLSLDRLEGRLIDETIDCLYPKERRGGRRVVRTLLIAAVLASLFTAAAFASDFLGFREAIIRSGSIGRIPGLYRHARGREHGDAGYVQQRECQHDKA